MCYNNSIVDIYPEDRYGFVLVVNRKRIIERGDSVVELDNFKSVLLGYKAPLQEVRDSL